MKRVLVGVLSLVLVLTACTAFPNPFKQQSQLKPSFWGQRVTMENTEVPLEARSGSESSLWGLTTQGNFFIRYDSDRVPYIWNDEEKRRIELTPANAEAEALMHYYLEGYFAQQGEEVPSNLHGQELVGKYLLTDGRAVLSPRSIGATFGGDYICAQDRNGMTWLIDAETGKMYGGRERWYRSATDTILLATGPAPAMQVFLLDKETDTITFRDYSRTHGFESDQCCITAASFLPDGSICVVLRDMQMNMETGEICKLLIDRPDGSKEIYDLGRIFFGKEPDQIYSVDSRHILLTSSTFARIVKPYFVDCETNEVSFMSNLNDQITLELYMNYLNDQGMVEFSNENNDLLMILESMGDGQTILLQDGEGRLLLFKPDTKECQFLLNGGGFIYQPMMIYFMGNGYDRFWYAAQDRELLTYYTLRILD